MGKEGVCVPRGGPGHARVAKLVVLVTHVHMRRLRVR